MDISNNYIRLSRIDGISPKEKLELIEKYGIKNVFSLDKSQAFEIFKNKEKVDSFFKIINNDNLNEYLEYIYKNSISIININDKIYPQMLKNIYDPPIVLYAKGNINIINNLGIAIVGARNASQYGINIARDMGYRLAKRGFNIVSGLAKGIDKYSHIGALKAHGNTIAVIGTGLDVVYPSENVQLYKDIIEKNGLIITEYPIGASLKPMNFPARNRIISGLTIGTLVIEATQRSGALITADFALEQGKNVYAIPRQYY